MNNVELIIEKRDMSSFMVSVGLGLMLETFFDPFTTRIDDERKVNKVDINKFKTHYYNIHTMIRNIISAISNADFKKEVLKNHSTPKYILNALMNELLLLHDIYEFTKCEPILYIPNYSSVIKDIDNSIKYESLSDTNKQIYDITENVIKLFKLVKEVPISTINIKTDLPISLDNTLITTHIPYDLLNVSRISKLYLVESHTGTVKDKSKFNTKYHDIGSKIDKTIFPFNETLLLILGDNVLIKPYKISYRYMLAEKAIEDKWTTFTSESRCKIIVNKVEHEYFVKTNNIK